MTLACQILSLANIQTKFLKLSYSIIFHLPSRVWIMIQTYVKKNNYNLIPSTL